MFSFKITYFQKSVALVVLGYLPKLKKGMGVVFIADFLLTFS